MKKVEHNGITYFVDKDLIGTKELKQAIKDIVETRYNGDDLEAYSYKNVFVGVSGKKYYIWRSKNNNKKIGRSFRYKQDNEKNERAIMERRIINE